MTAANVSQPGSLTVQEKAKLRRVLGRRDLILFAASAIISLETVSFESSIGAQSIFWLAFSFFFFLVPYGFLTAELSSAFPVEGGPYEWARMAFGRLAGGVTALMYWIAIPIWVGGSLAAAAIATVNSFILSKPMGKWSEIVFGLAFVWVSVAIAIIGLRFGKWVPNIGTILKAALVVVFVVMSVAFLVQRGRPAGTMHVHDLSPGITGFLFLAGVLVFNWGGFELPGAASEEMDNPQRDVPKMILGSGIIATLCYGLLLLFILLVIPAAHLTNVSSFTDAYSNVAGILGGLKPTFNWIIALAVVVAFVASAATWIIGSDRVQAIAALDGAAPAWMGRFAKIGTPIAVNLTTATVGSIFVFLVFLFSSGKLAAFFSVMISLTISTTVIAYLVLIPAVARLRTTQPTVSRPFRVPGGSFGLWASVISTELLCFIALVTLIWPGFIDGLLGQKYSMTANWSVSRVFYEATTLGTLAVIMALAVIFWAIGRRDRERGVTGETELALDAAAGTSPTT